MTKHSKRYRSLAAKVDAKTLLPLDEAVELLKTFNTTKFDQTVEIAIRLGIDPKQADQLVRGSLVLPHGIGKTQRVIVFAKGDLAEAAGQPGPTRSARRIWPSGSRTAGWISTPASPSPDMMGVVGPLGKVLGPRGLMPSPRAGTVTTDVAKVVKEYKAGKVEFRNDSAGIVHAMVGKLSFDPQKLQENIQAFIDHIQSLKPAAVKGTYVRGMTISATMSPSVRIAA